MTNPRTNRIFLLSASALALALAASPQATAAGPGTDAFGNSITSSLDDPTISTNLFMDIGGTGALLVTGDDTAAQNTNIGFLFPFYGTGSNTFSFTTNGYISTDPVDGGGDLSNDNALPTAPSTGNGGRIYPYHDDTEAQVFGQHLSAAESPFGVETYVSQWNACHFNCTSGTDLTLQYNVFMLADGTIIYAYKDVSAEAGSEATIGIQNTAVTDGVAYLINEGVMVDGMTIVVRAPTSAPLSILFGNKLSAVNATLSSIISGDVANMVGTFADRANARYAGGVEPAADVANPYLPGGTGGLWMRLGGASADGKGDAGSFTGMDYERDQWFAQAGLSHVLYDGGDKKWVGSLFGQYSKSDTDLTGNFNTSGGVKNEGFGVGYSSTWLFDSGLYFDGAGLAQWQDVKVSSATGVTGKTDAFVMASSAELGMKFAMGNGMTLTPEVQAVYQRIDIDGYSDSAGLSHSFKDNDSLVGRAGLSLGYGGTSEDGGHQINASLTASVLEQFMDGGVTVVNGVDRGFSGFDKTSWMVASHVAYTPVSTGFGIGLNVNYRDTFSGAGESSFGGDVALSWRW